MTIKEIKERLENNTLSRETEQNEGFIVLQRLEDRMSSMSNIFLRTHSMSWVHDELSGYKEFILAQNTLFLILIQEEGFKDEEEI